jgi:hypothetical protein
VDRLGVGRLNHLPAGASNATLNTLGVKYRPKHLLLLNSGKVAGDYHENRSG